MAVSKSEFIRQYLIQHPEAIAAETVAAAAAQSLVIRVQSFYDIRMRLQQSGLLPPPPPSVAVGDKSAFVRSYLQQHPEAGDKAVVAAAAEQGLGISVSLVAHVKTREKLKRRVLIRRGLEAEASPQPQPQPQPTDAGTPATRTT